MGFPRGGGSQAYPARPHPAPYSAAGSGKPSPSSATMAAFQASSRDSLALRLALVHQREIAALADAPLRPQADASLIPG